MPANARTPTPGLVGAASRAKPRADAPRLAVSCLGIRRARAPLLACAESVTGCHPSRAAGRAWCFVRTLDSLTPTAAGNAGTRTGLWARPAGPDCARGSWRARTQAAAGSAPHSSPPRLRVHLKPPKIWKKNDFGNAGAYRPVGREADKDWNVLGRAEVEAPPFGRHVQQVTLLNICNPAPLNQAPATIHALCFGCCTLKRWVSSVDLSTLKSTSPHKKFPVLEAAQGLAPRALWLALGLGSAVLSSAASWQLSQNPAALAAVACACVRCAIGDSSRDTPSSLAVRLRGGMEADRQAFILKSPLHREFCTVRFT